MSYPPVTQFETRAFEAEARAELTAERRARRLAAPAHRRPRPWTLFAVRRAAWATR